MMIVKNDLFDYKNRYIWQIDGGFKFSLDSILLAEYVKVRNNLSILDMCTGNAPIPLIISTKTNSKIVGFEIQKDIANLAKKSVEENKLGNQIKIINDDINNIGKYEEKNSFDVITCNPPYFKENSSLVNKNDYKSLARHEITINLDNIFSLGFKYLKNNGILYMVHRPERLDDIIILANKYRINVKELILIITNGSMIPTLVLVKCVKNSKSGIKFRKIYDVSKCITYQHIFDSE